VRAALLLATLLLLAGCTTRERVNPLDPKNEQTGGALVGFNAIAANGVVELRWPELPLNGLVGYRIQRWKPGEPPEYLRSSDYAPTTIAAEDSGVANDSTYVYRLIAHLAGGDSALSAPDTATPGTRQIFLLEADIPALTRLTPDARDFLYQLASDKSYADLELDKKHGVLWVSADDAGLVLKKSFEGATVGEPNPIGTPGDLTVSNNRGVAWVVSITGQRVVQFGPDLNDPAIQRSISGVGHPRVVEAGTLDPSVWIGNDEGEVYRYRAADGTLETFWSLHAGLIRAIALDETQGCAWVVTRETTTGNLYYLNPADTSATLVLPDLINVVDLAVDHGTGDLWISERAAPQLGAGRLSHITRAGTMIGALTGVEPYGIDVDSLDGTCWATDLHSNRLLHVGPNGNVLRYSPPLQTPYAVRVYIP